MSSGCAWTVRIDCGVWSLAIQFSELHPQDGDHAPCDIEHARGFLFDSYAYEYSNTFFPVGDDHDRVADLIHRLHLIYPRMGIRPERC